MKQRIRLVAGVFLLLVIVGGSCKKSSNNNPFGTARIATAVISHGGSVEQYQFFYDTYNNIDSASITGTGAAAGQSGYLKYSYIGSSWSVTDQNNNAFNVYANTAGMLLKVLVPDTLTFSYTNNQLTEINEYQSSTTPPYYTNTPTYYTWLNGDVTAAITGSVSQTYTYNTGKNGQPGDALRINDFLAWGASAIKTTHLVTAIANNATTGANYYYAFDGQGRISQLTQVVYDKGVSANDTTTYAYTYY